MKHLVLIILLFAVLAVAGCINPDATLTPKTPTELAAEHITKTSCDADHACPDGYSCFNFPGKSVPLCATPGPCAYYSCPTGKRCNVAENTNPAQVSCV